MEEFFNNHIENVFYSDEGIYGLFGAFCIACILKLLWNTIWGKKETKKIFFLKSFILAYIPALLISGTNSEFLATATNVVMTLSFTIMFAILLFSFE